MSIEIRVPFAGKGSDEQIEYEIIVEMEKGQLFKVNDCSESSFQYKLRRVQRLFVGKKIIVRKKIVWNYYYEAEIEN